MAAIEVIGGRRLKGELKIHGSKNTVLPMMAASILNKGKCVIHHCPVISDVFSMIELLKHIGCKVSFEGRSLTVDATEISKTSIDVEYATKFRSSIIFLGPMLGREKEVSIARPGGCSIGKRPIDYHVNALMKMNAEIEDNNKVLNCKTTQLMGQDIVLNYPSVGATENIMLAGVLAKGTTTIRNAAREPEIFELSLFLNSMGADVTIDETGTVVIKGVKELHDTEFTVSADRIVVATYGCAVAATGGHIVMNADCLSQLKTILDVLDMIGCEIKTGNDFIEIKNDGRPKAVPYIKTSPYPGFPTDMQSQLLVALSLANGQESIVEESVFEGRFKTTKELNRMGANIIVKERLAYITGVTKLRGTDVSAPDLRGGAALVLAGMAAEGKTTIHDIDYIYRGYEDIVKDLSLLGANIKLI